MLVFSASFIVQFLICSLWYTLTHQRGQLEWKWKREKRVPVNLVSWLKACLYPELKMIPVLQWLAVFATTLRCSTDECYQQCIFVSFAAMCATSAVFACVLFHLLSALQIMWQLCFCGTSGFSITDFDICRTELQQNPFTFLTASSTNSKHWFLTSFLQPLP